MQKKEITKAVAYAISAEANDITANAGAIKAVVESLTALGRGVDNNVKELTIEQLKAVFEGKGKTAGCAAVFHAIFTSEDYNVKRFASRIRDYTERCGLKLDGSVPKKLVLPEGMNEATPWAEFEAYCRAIEFNPKASESTEDKDKRIKKEKEDKKKLWTGKSGELQFKLELLKLGKRIGTNNPKLAKQAKLMALNIDALLCTLAEKAADKTLIRKIPEDIPFKE